VLRRFIDGSARVLLATDAASEGLNLHERCRLVIHLELPWTPVRLEQRVGRVDRIGQRTRVHQIALVAGGTAEQAVVAARIRQRAARLGQTMAAMRPDGVDERALAEEIVGVAPSRVGETDAVSLPDGVFVADLRARARQESERASTARRLGPPRAPHVNGDRPFAAATRNGTHVWWAFRIGCESAEEDVVPEVLVGVSYTLGRVRVPGTESLRQHLERMHGLLQPHIDQLVAALLAAADSGQRSATLLAIARERSIVAELERRDARLAASLVQRALFDRHHERQTSAQREIVHEALARCHRHLARLSRRLDPPAPAIDPVFAVIVRRQRGSGVPANRRRRQDVVVNRPKDGCE
jgi:hypothetical protein